MPAAISFDRSASLQSWAKSRCQPGIALGRDHLPRYRAFMNAHIASLAEEAERLPPADRIELVERLLSSQMSPPA